MPSVQPIPTVSNLLQAFRDGVVGQRERRADTRSGSGYDLTDGPGAILWSRQAQRDRDMFRGVYFDTAEGDDLTARGQALYGVTRFLDTYGTGVASFTRPTAGAGGGTIPAGTRIFVLPSSGIADARVYAVASDTPVAASALSAPAVPVRATTLGPGTAISALSSGGYLFRVDDPLWDTSWTVQSLATTDGTSFEPAADYRARVRANRFASRAGYAAAIIAACANVGATNVVLFASNWAGDSNDYGLNWCYVSDASFTGSPSLVTACAVALESVRVLGADLQVLPITTSSLSVSVTASLWDDPGNFNQNDITDAIQASVAAYFDGRKNAYAYQLDAIFGAVARASTAVQNVTINSPVSNVGVTTNVNGIPTFPAVLTRYVVSRPNIAVAFTGPQ
jgi:Baseplate J-like protein